MRVIDKLTDYEFMRIVIFMNERFGINLEKKREHIETRLACDLDKLGVATYHELVETIEIEPDGAVAQEMVDRLTTNHTSFFRDMESFKHLRGLLCENKFGERDTIRLWSAGCATGQECYTALMMLDMALSDNDKKCDYEIFATDISVKALDTARKAVYPMSAKSEIPEEYFNRYCDCSADGATFTISKRLYSHVRFARMNLMDDVFSDERFDAVFCRNVMIYFKTETRERILNKLYSAVKSGGYLYTGTVELILSGNPFDFVSPAVYQKKEGAREQTWTKR